MVSERSGWQVRGELQPNSSGQGATLTTGNSATLSRQIELSQAGHYVFRIMGKSDAHVAQMSVEGALDYDTEGTPFTAYYYGAFAMPLGRSKAFQVHELPFVIENGSEPRTITAKLEIKRGGGKIELQSVELIRLDDTRQQHRWGQNLPADSIHGLTTLKAAANYDRPEFAAFEDTWTGAEVWLVSQGLQSRLQYPGTPNFTTDGKYFFLTSPGHVLRTDGSQRYGPFKAERIDSRYLPWPAKWMRDHLPSDRDSTDWMISEYPDQPLGASPRFSTHSGKPDASAFRLIPPTYKLTNVVTGATATVELPQCAGWRLVKMPTDEPGTEVGTDPNSWCLWISVDRQRLAISDSHGKQFQEIKMKSDSDDPAKDYLNDPFWSIDADGHWYVSYILNWLKLHNTFKKTPENSINPGQIWMIPATPTIGEPLRVVEGLKPGIKRRILSNGVAVRRAENMGGGHQALSPDRELQINMLQKSSAFAIQSRRTGEVWHLGNFPYLEHPEWVWQRDFGTVRGDLRPLPLFFFDTRHQSMWPIVSMNYHDYGERLQAHRQNQYGKTVFFPAQATSPDGTKVAYASGMLSDSPASKADVYFAVARYPLPPVNLRVVERITRSHGRQTVDSVRGRPRAGERSYDEMTLTWTPPRYSREIAGYHVYHSSKSGEGYRRLTTSPVNEEQFEVSSNGFYVVTSVEHSGLESRTFSNEVSVNGAGPSRIYCEAEFSKFIKPFEPWFDQPTASNAYAVGVLDRDLFYRERLRVGLIAKATQTLLIPQAGRYTVWARVRKRFAEESGRFHIKLNEAPAGEIIVDRRVGADRWSWIETTAAPVRLASGEVQLAFTTSDTGILIDQILLTDDLDLMPPPTGNRPTTKPTVPSELKITKREDSAVTLTWTPSTAPQGVTRHQIYRSTQPDFPTTQSFLIGTSRQPRFVDVGLDESAHYYHIVAEDNWRNRSEATAPVRINR